MKNNSINFIVTIVLAVILSQFLPWWSVMLASLISALLIRLKKSAVFFVPFIAITFFWMAYAFYLGNANDFILANKIGVLLPLGGSSFLLILVTGIIGGIAAGISAVFGKQVASILKS
ncbi:hypothetical protein [Winogradskyella sp.]|uniref:hypothetical protein n=1 Tax=Winogradskyella sp. TaxID=1883156 RepID=UPI0035C7F8A5